MRLLQNGDLKENIIRCGLNELAMSGDVLILDIILSTAQVTLKLFLSYKLTNETPTLHLIKNNRQPLLKFQIGNVLFGFHSKPFKLQGDTVAPFILMETCNGVLGGGEL